MAILNTVAGWLYDNSVALVMVILGLGFVIFIHELGHFLLAKWNGVKVEKFAIGFDLFNLRLYQKKIGETTYVLGALPLGGYVKMLGEDPGEAQNPEAINDPRAYQNKPVGARMAIISAGVVMNILFGVACFMYVYMRGKAEVPPMIGSVMPGTPAYEAGILPNDRIVSVDGKPATTFDKLRMAAIFSGQGQVLRLQVQRPGDAAPRTISLSPRVNNRALYPTLGVAPPADNELPEKSPFIPPAGFEGDAAAIARVLKGGGIIESARVPDAEPWSIASVGDLQNVFAAHAAKPIELRVRRGSFFDEGKAGGAKAPAVSVTLPPMHMVDFGLRMEVHPIASLRGGGPAAKAGVEVGDRLISVDGQESWDPMRLPELVYRAAKDGREVTLVVERRSSSDTQSAPDRLRFSIKPDDLPPWGQDVMNDALLDVPGLGLAFPVGPKIAVVDPGSPAEAAGLKAGQSIRTVTISEPGDADAPSGSDEAKPAPMTFVLGGRDPGKGELGGSWTGAFVAIQGLPRQEVTFGLDDGRKVKIEPRPVADWYLTKRGLRLLGMLRKLPPQGVPAALVSAWSDTVEATASVYFMLRGLIQRRLSNDAVGGPLQIGRMAFSTAKQGFDSFIPFLGILSINLAVVNFFPIPPLDGGQLLFLIAEKVRGRPVPERLATPLILAGLAFILLLFLLVNIKDVFSLLRG